MASSASYGGGSGDAGASKKKKGRRDADTAGQKRRCISTACIACRKRKSKCDGALPSCAACASVYGTECIYDPNSDHRRKGVYRDKVDSTKAKESTLQVLIDAIINSGEEDAPRIARKIRDCDNLDALAQQFLRTDLESTDGSLGNTDDELYLPLTGERDLAGKMGELRLENGSVRYIGGTSNLIYLGGTTPSDGYSDRSTPQSSGAVVPITTWTEVTNDISLITHLMNMYFAYHYAYFTTLSKDLFWSDFMKGKAENASHCSSLLVNAMLALGCHFTDIPGAYAVAGDNRTKGDHFFNEAKRLIVENDLFERPHLVTVQALALMSVREAGCGREAKGWVYSGMSFRMALDIGLNFEMSQEKEPMTDEEIDARRITFWGCFLFDKCWSNYMGRLPQLPRSSCNVPKFDVFPGEDSSLWMPLTDKGFDESFKQPARTRAAALQLASLCEISSDILRFFYHPSHIGRTSGKGAELKKLGELHQRLEEWHKDLPKEFEPKDGQLPNVILMHMFFHLQYIHLFRPFLKYAPNASPLPSHVSPRRICTANAGAISKLMRLYKKTWNLRQICNIAVYMTHSACTIHLLNLPEKTAKRDLIHGVKHLEEIAQDWLCARRTLSILSVLARKWNVELPEDAAAILQRADDKFGSYSTSDVPSPRSSSGRSATASEELTPSAIKQEFINSNNNGAYMLSQAAQPSIESRLDLSPQAAMRSGIPSQHVSSHSSPMHGGFSPIDTWNHQSPLPVTPVSHGTPNYPMAMAPTSMVAPHSHVQIPDITSKAAMDTSQWLLTDSAQWQRNFEGWDLSMPNAANNFIVGDLGAGPAMGQLGPRGAEHQQGSSQAPNVHGQYARNGMDDYEASLSCGGWLPRLD